MRLALMALFVVGATVTAQQPSGMWGWYQSRAIGNEYVAWAGQTGMSGEDCGIRVGIGRVNAAEHEIADGSFNLGTMGPDRVTVIMPRGANALLWAKGFDGKDAELRLREIPQRTPERLK